jgi:hypothetical protein
MVGAAVGIAVGVRVGAAGSVGRAAGVAVLAWIACVVTTGARVVLVEKKMTRSSTTPKIARNVSLKTDLVVSSYLLKSTGRQ